MKRAIVAIAVTGSLLSAGSARAQGASPDCVGDLNAADVQPKPGPALRFGITPGVQAGQVGPNPAPAVPEDRDRTLARLGELRRPDAPLVLRLHRFFWADREAGIQRFLELAERYTTRGYEVELQLRYHPDSQQEGDIATWTEYVREVVRRFGPNPHVVAVQVTNEVNFATSPDSSDGAYRGSRDALVQGVIAAKDEARRREFRGLEIGFNWFYRTPPDNEQSFWRHLRDRGGRPFVDAVDWVGLDAYPGTFFPPAEAPGEERDGLVNAMSTLRCYLAIPGIPSSVPIHVEENGWPTGPGRSPEMQAQVLETMVRAVHDYRGTYNVSDYRWFNLRDANTSSPNFQQQYGLLRDDYSPKPAFGIYRGLIAELAAPRALTGAGRCLRPPLPVSSTGVGSLRLGRRPGDLLAAPVPPSRRGPGAFRYCVEGGGRVLVAFAPRGSARLIVATGRGLAVRGIARGTRLSAARRRYPRALPAGRGLLRASARSRVVLGVTRRRVRFVAVGDRRVLARPATLRRYLRRLGL